MPIMVMTVIGYAVIRDFETLRYLLAEERIIADSSSQEITIDYIPVVEGGYGQQIIATTSHMDALFFKTADGQTELSTLTATGGITYEEEADESQKEKGQTKAIQFVGSDLFYDANNSVVTAWGDEIQPCLLNGALVPGIIYDLSTGKIKTEIAGPGMLK